MRWGLTLAMALLAGCSQEARTLGPTPPQTAPISDRDPRIGAYAGNFYLVSQGGRYFSWYGCHGCHTDDAPGVLNLADGRWRYGGGFAEVYGAIAARHGRLAYGQRVPAEQLWQLTAYVLDLPQHHPEKRRRLAIDTKAEPEGSTWTGRQ